MSKNVELAPYFLRDIHEKYRLDPGQIELGQQIFRFNKKLAMWQAGRKRGKTFTELYVLCRAACTIPNSMYYYFCPRVKQAREVLWASNRLQSFVPKRYIKKVRETEMRVVFYNDSWIKIDGSDEYEQYRGVEVDGAVYDEAKDFDFRFDGAFRPNLGPRKAFLLICGTPPRNSITPSERGYFRLVEEAKFREDGYFALAPSWDRPDEDWQEEVKRTKALYIERAKTDPDAWNEWRCEFGGEYVEGGPGAIFPMFRPERHVVDHAALISEIYPRLHELEFWCVADPGTSHPFAVSFWALDREKPKVYVLDEIYETDQKENTTNKIYPRIMAKINEFYPYPDLWNYRYDEAALWFKAHVMASHYDPGWTHTNKAEMRKKQPNEVKPFLDVIKDVLREDIMVMSSRCVMFQKEIVAYKRNEEGKLPRESDDLLDTARYFLASANFTFIPKVQHNLTNQADRRRLFTAYAEEPDDSAAQALELDTIGFDFSNW